jgi:hypothetical protein
MSDWGWVTFAYGVAYGSLALYATSIVVRIRTARRAIGDDK